MSESRERIMKTYLVRLTNRRLIKIVGAKYVRLAPINPAGTFAIWKNGHETTWVAGRGQFTFSL